MNERIEKLFDQALAEFQAENKYATVVVPDSLQRDFVAKFAELIVQECMKVGDLPTTKNQLPSDLIKEHFGVER